MRWPILQKIVSKKRICANVAYNVHTTSCVSPVSLEVFFVCVVFLLMLFVHHRIVVHCHQKTSLVDEVVALVAAQPVALRVAHKAIQTRWRRERSSSTILEAEADAPIRHWVVCEANLTNWLEVRARADGNSRTVLETEVHWKHLNHQEQWNETTDLEMDSKTLHRLPECRHDLRDTWLLSTDHIGSVFHLQ